MAENRDVAVKMKFTADTAQATSSMKDLQKHAKDTSAAVNDANKKTDSDSTKKWIEFGKLAASAMIVGKAIDALTKSLQIFGDKTVDLSTRITRAVDAGFSNLPILGSIYRPVKSLVAEAAFGDSLRDLNQQQFMAEFEARRAGLDPMRQQIDLLRREREGRGDRFLPKANLINQIERENLVGGHAFTEKQLQEASVRQALLGRVTAQRERGVADLVFNRDQRQATFSGKQVAAAENELRSLRNEMGGMAGGGFNEAALAAKRAEVIAKENELLRIQKQHMADLMRVKESELALAQKTFELDKASTEVKKARLNLLQQEETKAKSNATQFGMMGAGDRLAVQAALEDARRMGFENISQERRQLLAQTGLTSEFAGEQARKSIQNDMTYQNVVGLVGQKTAEQLEKEVKELSKEIELKLSFDEKKLTDSVEEIAGRVLGRMLSTLSSMIGVSEQTLQNQLIQQKVLKQFE